MIDPTRRTSARARELALAPPPTITRPPTYLQLMQGWAFFWDHPASDLVAWARERLADAPTEGVRAALAPACERGTVRAAKAIEVAYEAAAADTRLPRETRGECLDHAIRARLSAAFLGDVDSALRSALDVDTEYATRHCDAERRLLLVTRQELLETARYATVEAYRPMSSRAPLRGQVWVDLVARAEVVSVFQETRPTGPVRDDWFLDDLDEPAVIEEERPGIRVVDSVEHLPGTASNGSRPSSASTPRAEFAPVAGVRLDCQPLPDLVEVRARLVARFPHAAALIDRVLATAVGQPFARLRPVLLVGPPGCGKTRLAVEICEALGLMVTVYSCAGVSDSSLIGTSRQWGTGRGSVPLQSIRRHLSATVAIVVDEVEKVGQSRHNGNAQDGLLGMLDHADRVFDPYVECEVNLSGVTYIATANSRAGITDPLRDRFLVLQMPPPRPEDLPVLAAGIIEDIREERGIGEDWLPGLDGEEMAAVVAHHRPGGSIRSLRRLVEAALAARESLAPRH